MLDPFLSFVERAGRSTSLPELMNAMQGTVERLGFSGFTYVVMPLPEVISEAVVISTYPQAWQDRYREAGYHRIDPVIRRVGLGPCLFDWTAQWLRQESAEQPDFFLEASETGIDSGVTLPYYAGGQLRGALSLARGEEGANTALSALVGMYFVLQVGAFLNETVAAAAALSSREIECLKWKAAGKTRWETSKILNISEATVAFHLGRAREKLRAATTTQAVAAALRLGIIEL